MEPSSQRRMNNRNHPANPGHHLSGYGLGLLGIFLVSLALRFWSLDRFNQLAFDEIYYVRYAVNYLDQQPLFDAHPPLGKYLIAAGIWIGDRLLFSHLTAPDHLTNELAGRWLSPYSYRWLNAVVGSTIPLLIAGIARQLSEVFVDQSRVDQSKVGLAHRGKSLGLQVGLWAGSLAALDGFFLVESRFGLLHVYLVAFGLLGHWCWLKALSAPAGDSCGGLRSDRWRWLLNAGLSFGACISVKWNGLGYWLGPVLLWMGAWLVLQWQRQPNPWPAPPPRETELVSAPLLEAGLVLRRLGSISPSQIGLFLVVVPALVYTLQWLPHLGFNPGVGLFKLHQQILGFHQSAAVQGAQVHDYCSPWWSWPLMIRPVAYALSQGGQPPVYFAVYALGNPLLWWWSSLAVGVTGAATLWAAARRAAGMAAGMARGMPRFLHRLQTAAQDLSRRDRSSPAHSQTSPLPLGVGLYLLVSYCTNWLPWALVHRCTFVYHYLGALSFSMIALAWWLAAAWRKGGDWRSGAVVVMGLMAIAFVFWMPIWLGLPLSGAAFRLRLLLPTWP